MTTNEIERIAVTLAVEYEQAQGRQVTDVGHGWPVGLGPQVQQWTSSRRFTCDLVSRNPDGSLARLIEVKGRGGPTSVSICDRQHSAMMGCGERWWLYVALECRTDHPKLVVVREPARLPWRRLPGAVGTPHGRPRVRDEGDWHVSQNDILTLGHALTPSPPQFIQNQNKFPGWTAEKLLALADPSPLPATADAPATPTEQEPEHASEAGAHVLLEEDEMKRRTLIRGLVVGTTLGITDAALEVMAAARQRMDLALESSAIGPATLERWETTAFEYAHAYQTVPPHRLLADVLADFTEVQRLLEQRQPIRYRRRLCRVAAQLAALAGIFASALGAHREARGWFHTGRLAASEAGDNQLEGALTVRSAIVSLYYGTPASAHEQAARARHILGDTVGPATTRGLLVEARALARMGRVDEALPLLRQAEDAFGRLTAEDRDDPSFGHTERQFLWHLGNAWTHLGRTEDAWQVQHRALDLYPPTEYLDPTLIRLDRATCLARSGEPEEAYRTATQALTALPDEHRTGMVMKYATDFSRTAGHTQLPAGREFAELLRA